MVSHLEARRQNSFAGVSPTGLHCPYGSSLQRWRPFVPDIWKVAALQDPCGWVRDIALPTAAPLSTALSVDYSQQLSIAAWQKASGIILCIAAWYGAGGITL